MSNGNQASIAINDDLILRWYNDRKGQSEVNSILNGAGNTFSFSQELYAGDLHLYIGLNESGQLSVTEIYAETDTVQNMNCLSINTVPSQKQEIGDIDPVYPVNADSIELSTAKNWVSNWMDDEIRAKYIQQCFDEGNDSVLMAFEVHKMDFDNGTVHTGYLGLELGEDDKYVPHVIVLNENPENGSVNLEDMTRCVPPYWGTNDFGMLKRLNIQ